MAVLFFWPSVGQMSKARTARLLVASVVFGVWLCIRFALHSPCFQKGVLLRDCEEDYLGDAAHLIQNAARAGIPFRDWSYVSNTLQAHRLVQYAQRFGRGTDVVKSIFRATFEMGQNVSDVKVLVDIGRKWGLTGVYVLCKLYVGVCPLSLSHFSGGQRSSPHFPLYKSAHCTHGRKTGIFCHSPILTATASEDALLQQCELTLHHSNLVKSCNPCHCC